MKKHPETDATSPEEHADPSFTCKIIPDCDELPTSGKQWTRAKRCRLRFQDDGLSCNDILIPYAEITKARIHIYQSALFFEYAVFSICHGGKTTHFGITYSDYWKGELPFDVERIHEESPYIFLRRILMIVIIAYIFWEVINI